MKELMQIKNLFVIPREDANKDNEVNKNNDNNENICNCEDSSNNKIIIMSVLLTFFGCVVAFGLLYYFWLSKIRKISN